MRLKVAIQVDSVPLTHSDQIEIGRKESGDTMDTSERNVKIWKSSYVMNTAISYQEVSTPNPKRTVKITPGDLSMILT